MKLQQNPVQFSHLPLKASGFEPSILHTVRRPYTQYY